MNKIPYWRRLHINDFLWSYCDACKQSYAQCVLDRPGRFPILGMPRPDNGGISYLREHEALCLLVQYAAKHCKCMLHVKDMITRLHLYCPCENTEQLDYMATLIRRYYV